jgi:hypothetical protein
MISAKMARTLCLHRVLLVPQVNTDVSTLISSSLPHLFIISYLLNLLRKTPHCSRTLLDSIVIKFRELIQGLLHSSQLLRSLALYPISHKQQRKQEKHIRAQGSGIQLTVPMTSFGTGMPFILTGAGA